MGTWNTKLNGNDTFQDIYQGFFDLYNQGISPLDASKQIQEDFGEMFMDYEDRNNSLFGLALAQWETQSLDNKIFIQVKEIIETGNDIGLWENLGADTKTLEKRRKELDLFLAKISIIKEKPKRRVRPKYESSSIKLLVLPAPDGNKIFEISEHYGNGEYQFTASLILWPSGGSGIFHFCTKDKAITAKWLDSQTLEIRHDKTIEFSQKLKKFYYSGDQGIIDYIEEY